LSFCTGVLGESFAHTKFFGEFNFDDTFTPNPREMLLFGEARVLEKGAGLRKVNWAMVEVQGV